MEQTYEEILVSVVLPAYNEELAVGKDVDTIKTTMDQSGYSYEIIVVDDGSVDATATIAKEHGARVIQHPKNRGVGWAHNTGMKWARGEIIVMSDADGTYPLYEIPRMLKELEHSDMVVGARRIEAGTAKWLRKPAKALVRGLASFITSETIPDLNSGLRAFRKKTAFRFLNILPSTHSWVSTITMAYLCNNYSIKYIDIDYFPRIGKSTFHPIKDTFYYLTLVLRTLIMFRPLRFFFPLSVLLCLWGLQKTVYDWLVHSNIRESDVLIIVVGVVVGVFGILADLNVATLRSQYRQPEQTHDKEL